MLYLRYWLVIALISTQCASAQTAPQQLHPNRPATTAPVKPLQGKIEPADQAMVIAKANNYLNLAIWMTADFVQTGADGHRTEGKLYVQKPGHMRFEYNSPATLEIIADGTSVAVRDKKLGTQDLYFIGQTPLKFLLKDQIDINRDTKVLDVTRDANIVSIFIEDKVTFGGTSRIKLSFDASSFALKQWKVVDPQGYETLVSLSNIDTSKKPDAGLFKINQENFRQSNSNR